MPETLNEPETRTKLVLQMDYNSKRVGDPDSWQWIDNPIKLRGTREEQIAEARAHVKRGGTSKFIRGYRIVERLTVTTDTLVEELDPNG